MEYPTLVQKRRAVLGCGVACLAVLSLRAAAQPAPASIAVLVTGSDPDEAVRFRRVLETAGLVPGKDFVLDVYWAEGNYARFPALAQAAVARNPAVILVTTGAAARAARQVTRTIPIVMFGLNDPVGSGLIASYAQPGGNITGTASMAEEYVGKLLELAREVVPAARRIAVLVNPLNPSNGPIFNTFERFARAAGVTAEPVEISTHEHIGTALAELGRRRPDALITGLDSSLTAVGARERFAEFAAAKGVPIISVDASYTSTGAVVTYTAQRLLARMAAVYVRRILAGAKPQDLPVQHPTTFELVVNLKVAQALKLKLPPTLLLRATHVIE